MFHDRHWRYTNEYNMALPVYSVVGKKNKLNNYKIFIFLIHQVTILLNKLRPFVSVNVLARYEKEAHCAAFVLKVDS